MRFMQKENHNTEIILQEVMYLIKNLYIIIFLF